MELQSATKVVRQTMSNADYLAIDSYNTLVFGQKFRRCNGQTIANIKTKLNRILRKDALKEETLYQL